MEYVNVGKIVNTRGLKGDLKVIPSTSFIEERFARGSILYISFKNEIIEVEVVKSSKDPKFVYVAFKDYQDINLVEKFKGCDIVYPVEQLRDLEEDNYYYHDLLTMEVYLDTKYIGKVGNIEESNKITMIRVLKDDNKEILILFMKQFIKSVDVENKKIYLNDIEGLL